MKLIKKIKSNLQSNTSIENICKAVLILLVVYLLSLTSHVWLTITLTFLKILTPFLAGFIIAYLIHPLVVKFERFGVSRKLVIPCLFVLIIGCLGWLIFAISPTIYSRVIDFINSMIQGVNALFEIYVDVNENSPSPVIHALVDQFNQIMNNSKIWLPNFSILLPRIFNGFLSTLTNILFTIIISFYFLLDYERFTMVFDRLSEAINTDLPMIYEQIDDKIGSYLYGLVILMVVKFVEYSILYALVGHKDWIIIALLTSIGLLIPYFGATVANSIGLLTALSLPTSNFVVLCIGIIVLSNIDAYILAPLVHLKNSRIRPLWTLFSIFAGGILLGPIGIMLSVPMFMVISVIYNYYREKTNRVE